MRRSIILMMCAIAGWACIFIWPIVPTTLLNTFFWPIIPYSLYPKQRVRDYAARHSAFLHTEHFAGGRVELSCTQFSAGTHSAVILTFGQSNAANHEQKKTIAGPNVGNFNPTDGKCYQAEDPMLGATGNEGSIWPVMGQDLVNSGLYKRVLIVPVGVGNSEIEDWAPPSQVFFPRVEHAMKMLTAAHLQISSVIFQQGEMDAAIGTPTDKYVRHIKEIVGGLRQEGVSTPIILAIATSCGGDVSPSMKLARSKLPNNNDVYEGPDFGEVHIRYNECHLFESDARKEGLALANQIISIVTGAAARAHTAKK